MSTKSHYKILLRKIGAIIAEKRRRAVQLEQDFQKIPNCGVSTNIWQNQTGKFSKSLDKIEHSQKIVNAFVG